MVHYLKSLIVEAPMRQCVNIVDIAKFITMARGSKVLNGGQVTTRRCGGERAQFARLQSGC